MNNLFKICLLSGLTVISTAPAIAKQFIYDSRTNSYSEIQNNQSYNDCYQFYDDSDGTYLEIRDRSNYNNCLRPSNSPSSYNTRPMYQDDRYIYNGNQRIDKKLPRPSWDWKPGQKVPPQFRSEQYKVHYKDSPLLYPIGVDEQWYRINGDYVLAEDDYEILRILN